MVSLAPRHLYTRRAAAMLLAVLLCAVASSTLKAKDPTFQWWYGGTGDDEFNGLTATADGGFLMVGSSNSFVGNDNDVYVVRTDACGNLVWSATYDIRGGSYDVGRKVVRGQDGGYVIAGYSYNPLACLTTGNDPLVMKIDDSGNLVWAHVYPALEGDIAYDIAKYSTNEYVVAGSTGSFGAGNGDAFLMRIDLTGNPVFSRTYGSIGGDGFRAVAVASNGDVIGAGSTISYVNDLYDQVFVVRTNPDLTVQWSYHYGGDSTFDAANDVVAMKDGSISVLGRSSAASSFGYEQPYLLRLDSQGNCLCDAVFSIADTNSGEFDEAQEITNGELAVTGWYYNQAAGLGRYDVLLMRINSTCTKVAAEEYGIDWRDQGHGIVPLYTAGVTGPTGYVIAATSNSFSNGGRDDAYLIRADRNYLSGCHEYATVIKQKSPGYCARKAPTGSPLFAVSCSITTAPSFNTLSTMLCKACDPAAEEQNGNMLSRRDDGFGASGAARGVAANGRR